MVLGVVGVGVLHESIQPIEVQIRHLKLEVIANCDENVVGGVALDSSVQVGSNVRKLKTM